MRSCDARCHNAKKPACECWCGGLFHGGDAQASRDAFVNTFGAEPGTEEDFDRMTRQADLFRNAGDGDRWRIAVAAAVQARAARAV